MSSNVILFKAVSDEKAEDKYVTFLRERDYSTTVQAPIAFQFCNIEELVNNLQQPYSFAGLILTSPRCVAAIQLAIADRPELLQPWQELTTFVVGEATDKVAKSLKLKTKGNDSGNALELASLICKDKFTKPLLYPMGNLAKDTLCSSLDSSAVPVKTITVYKTIQHPKLEQFVQSLMQYLPADIVFFSPSGLDFVLSLCEKHAIPIGSQKIYAIGPTTEAAILNYNLPISGAAAKPTPEGLFAAIQPR